MNAITKIINQTLQSNQPPNPQRSRIISRLDRSSVSSSIIKRVKIPNISYTPNELSNAEQQSQFTVSITLLQEEALGWSTGMLEIYTVEGDNLLLSENINTNDLSYNFSNTVEIQYEQPITQLRLLLPVGGLTFPPIITTQVKTEVNGPLITELSDYYVIMNFLPRVAINGDYSEIILGTRESQIVHMDISIVLINASS